ncbi:MAG: hypothetical protein QOC92_2848 [Acidimicrobiaceae bacterium]|jgi:hypothetical protein
MPISSSSKEIGDAGPVRGIVAVMVVVVASSPTFTQRSEQTLPFAFNQGVARVEGGWVFSGTNSPFPGTDVLERTDDDLNVITTQPLPIPAMYRSQGYDHVGDIDIEGGVLYVPFEQPSYELGHQVTARYDPTTLTFIDAVELPQHENSFVTVDPSTMTAYSMDRFDGDTLLRYDVQAGWKPLPQLQLTMNLVHTQGADVADGAVWIATSDDHNGVYRVDLATGETTSVGTLGHLGLEGEGIDATALPSGAFHALVNNPVGALSFFGHYDLTDAGAVQAPTGGSTSPSGSAPTTVLAASGGQRWSPWSMFGLLGFAGCAWRLLGRRP